MQLGRPARMQGDRGGPRECRAAQRLPEKTRGCRGGLGSTPQDCPSLSQRREPSALNLGEERAHAQGEEGLSRSGDLGGNLGTSASNGPRGTRVQVQVLPWRTGAALLTFCLQEQLALTRVVSAAGRGSGMLVAGGSTNNVTRQGFHHPVFSLEPSHTHTHAHAQCRPARSSRPHAHPLASVRHLAHLLPV
jgi:hypothetical protein